MHYNEVWQWNVVGSDSCWQHNATGTDYSLRPSNMQSVLQRHAIVSMVTMPAHV